MSGTVSSSASSKTSETLSIKMHDIPTELLERLLADFVQQINTVYRKKQGDIVIQDLDQNTEVENTVNNSRKRTLAEISRIEKNLDVDDLVKERIQFSERQLENYGIPHDIISTKQVTKTDEPIADVMTVSILEVIQQSIRSKFPDDNDVHIEKSALSLMTRFVNLHILNISRRLQRLMEIQRRRLPNRDDLALLHREGIFDKSGIHEMYDLSKSWLNSGDGKKAQLLSSKADAAISIYMGTDSHSINTIDEVFLRNDEWWIDKVVERKKHKYYIPEWMPPLPPDYTYKATPKFNERVTDPIILREKLVNEGRVAEMALDHIIARKPHGLDILLPESDLVEVRDGLETNDDMSSANDDDSTNAMEDSVSVSVTQNDKEISNDPKEQNNKTDLVEFARKRMNILEERRKKEEERISSRINSEESHFGKNFGFYTKNKKLPDGIGEELDQFRQKKLQELVHNLRQQEKYNNEWFEKQETLRKKVAEEKSKYAEANEIELGAGVSNSELNFAFAAGDEEVDFDVEFSDMEDFADGTTKPPVATSSETASEEIRTVPTPGNETSSQIESNTENETGTAVVTVSGKRPYTDPAVGPVTTETPELLLSTPEVEVLDNGALASQADEDEDIDMEMFEDA